MSLLTGRFGAKGDKEGTGAIGWGKGTKGAFQGEQRPTETDPSLDNRWGLR